MKVNFEEMANGMIIFLEMDSLIMIPKDKVVALKNERGSSSGEAQVIKRKVAMANSREERVAIQTV